MTEDRDTSWTDEPVCPHCGYVETDSWEIDFGPGLEGETESSCADCGEDYFLRRHCVVTYEYSSYSKALGNDALPAPAAASTDGGGGTPYDDDIPF